MRFLALLALLSTPAVASDWFVDPVNGSNNDSGLDPANAWGSITYALAQVPTGAQTIHLMEGVFDVASGEQFPIALEDGITLLGDGNPRDVVVRTDGTAFLLDATVGDKSTTLSSFTVEGAMIGLRAESYDGLLRPTVTGMRFEDCDTGISYFIDVGFTGTLNRLLVTRSTFQDCAQYGIRGSGASFFPITTLIVEDSSFFHCGTGMALAAIGDSLSRGTVRRCRFRGNTWTGLQVESGESRITVEDSLITANANGIRSDAYVEVLRSTIADNVGAGIQSTFPTIFGFVQSSIVYGNGDDLQGVTFPVRHSNIGDGDFIGIEGNLSADPWFVDPTNRDYRLSFGSPCIDAAPLSTARDLLGFRRRIDGDLDTVVMDDMGAYELATLRTRKTVRLDRDFMIAVQGEVGAFAALFLDRSGPLSAPVATPFGPRWLNPNQQEFISTVQIDATGGAQFLVTLPDDPTLVGLTFGFQALIRSSAAPAGVAFSSVSQSVVLPQ